MTSPPPFMKAKMPPAALAARPKAFAIFASSRPIKAPAAPAAAKTPAVEVLWKPRQRACGCEVSAIRQAIS